MSGGGIMDETARSGADYRARAKQIRAEAERVPDIETRKALLDIAANYEQLANRVEKNKNSL